VRAPMRTLFSTAVCLATAAPGGAGAGRQFGPAPSFPDEKLPPAVTRLTDYGERADFSPDGRRILYVTRTGGEVEEIDLETRQVRRITTFPRPDGVGFYRALYLANGDYLLTGGPKRRETYFYVLDRSLAEPPTVLPGIVWEGPAVSRTRLRLAWTPNHEEIWLADLVYEGGTPALANARKIIDNEQIAVNGVRVQDWIEPQNFRPPDERELIFAQYGREAIFTSEVFGFDLASGTFVDYSKAPKQYDEPEGICPDGSCTLAESDRHNPKGTGYIDVYLLALDGSGRSERLTFFNDVPGFRASNPVVSDDGRFIAFQLGRTGDDAGVGHGLYLLDVAKAGLAEKIRPRPSH
jgi:hypothetical protein